VARNERSDVRAEIADRVIAALEAGAAPWHKSWSAIGGGLPRSMSTGKAYRGINVFLLALSEYSSPWWGTYKAITEKGGQVRKGEKSTSIILWKRFPKNVVNEETGRTETKSFMVLRTYNVFNAEQADGLADKYFPAPLEGAENVEEHPEASIVAKEYFGREGAPTLSYGGDRAYYNGGSDHIQLPDAADFEGDNEFQATRFHEMAHSTGHKSRCAREGVMTFEHFGSERYGKEELVAEMTAAMLMATCGIESTFDNSTAYLASWIKTIRGDNSLVVQAGAQAQRAMDNILGVTFEDE
jgi:antirestriction protein ArdC